MGAQVTPETSCGLWRSDASARFFPDQSQEILPIGGLAEEFAPRLDLARIDEALFESDLLQTGDLQALPLLDGAHEFARFQKGVMGACIQLGAAAPKVVNLKLSNPQICAVDIRNLQLAALGYILVEAPCIGLPLSPVKRSRPPRQCRSRLWLFRRAALVAVYLRGGETGSAPPLA